MLKSRIFSGWRWQEALGVVVLAVLYALLARLMLDYFHTPLGPPVWPSAGLLLAAVLLGGPRYALGGFLGGMGYHLWGGGTLPVALGVGVFNVTEALIVWRLLDGSGGFSISLWRARDFLRLLAACAVAAAVTSLMTVSLLHFAGVAAMSPWLMDLLQWWQGDMLGMMLLTPLVLVWIQPLAARELRLAYLVESGLCLLLTILAGQMVLLGWWVGMADGLMSVYWLFLFIGWAAARCSQRVVMLALAIITLQGFLGAMQGVGYFAADAARTNLENLWFFVTVITIVGFSLASKTNESAINAEALQREKTISDEIINSLPGVFYMFDARGPLVRWNPAMARVSGYSEAEMYGKSALDFIAPEDRAYIAEAIGRVFEVGENTAEGGFYTKAGQQMPYHFTGRRALIGGQPHLVGLGEDISERRAMENALKKSEELWKFALEGSGDAVWDWDVAADRIEYSLRYREILGLPTDAQNDAVDWLAMVHPDDVPLTVANKERLLQGEHGYSEIELRMRCPDGRVKWILSRGMVVSRDAQGRVLRVVGTNADITHRKEAEEALKKSEQLWKFALEGAGDAVWDWDVEHGSMSPSPRWKAMLGYEVDEMTGAWVDLMHPEDLPRMVQTQTEVLAGRLQTPTNEVRMRCKDGSWKWVLVRGMVVSQDAEGKPLRVVGTTADISAIKTHQDQLEYVAHYDGLTGLPNRLLLSLRLPQAMAQSLRRGQSLALAYLDLDGFKEINDQYGHDIGDQLLIAVARHMSEVMRDGDTLARIGGDEFLVVLADLNSARDCVPVLERLLQAASTVVTVDHLTLNVSASIGVTLYPEDDADADQLIRHADQAMYHAKQAGKNRYHLFDIEQDVALQRRQDVIRNVSQALGRDEFVLYYQPKVNLRRGQVIGAEALIRWQHPQEGLLAPGRFLPAIEDQEISIALGEWVIATALNQIACWQNLGLKVPVSVNITAYHLLQANFAERLGELLAASPRVDPALLELEILETSAFDDLSQVAAVIAACQTHGVSFALDDFGTGYSSLAYLKRLPARVLKIDQSFVRDMLEDHDDLSIVEGIIGLAAAFHRQVIAEGVESAAHGEALLGLGCEDVQGYGIARPMPADTLTTWMRDWCSQPCWQA
jgi:diguanylate cyclase (GGDEF)-like protein/PAS domain S-box-containing protein